jgi:hypothetical protein
MNEPTKTTDELLAEFDADLLVHPKRTTDDLLLELSLAARQLHEEADTLAAYIKLSLLTKGIQNDAPEAPSAFNAIENAIARLKRIKGTTHPPGKPRISK